ncbi:hypothetical protein H8L32_21480 [Undibacterium sp. CY18W]|uniref:Uncharacterized protein n=1 Tax=Undibacterium hunanense TaxID=2762292 RepID=A0ABR6ZWN8_9BURK|nr:hypothetical protein [Undibacterium hunanense]MBC3920054.1 hypothetical protein [Undibacterium hunanense]
MYLSKLSVLHPSETKNLRSFLDEHPSGDLLVVINSTSQEGEYAWLSRRGSKTQEGCGAINESTKTGVEVASHSTRVFHGDRLAFVRLLDQLADRERAGWSRSTFASDCRLSAADGLHDEQAWCETAFEHDGRPSEHTAYVVQVLGSQNYFAYFNFKWVGEDSSSVKSCHDLKTWASAYVPRMYGERDVERWVFLCKEDLETFSRVAVDYRRAFTLMDYSFEVFRAGGSPKRDPTLHPGVGSAAGTGLRAILQSALGRLGMSTAETWTPKDQTMVNRLTKVLADKASGPIDMTKSPLALPKLKSLLLKHLNLRNIPPAALTQNEVIRLYLGLARFYEGWDKVSCEALFSSNMRTFNIEAINECLTDDKVQHKLDRARQLLVAELISNGIEVDDSQ